jgi:hypothetical protein
MSSKNAGNLCGGCLKTFNDKDHPGAWWQTFDKKGKSGYFKPSNFYRGGKYNSSFLMKFY